MTISTPSEAPSLEALPEDATRQYSANEDLPPFRINATRVPERLSGSVPSAQHHHMRRRSGEWPRGRSRSPSMRDGENSSISSLDSSDILTDRMGFEDFDIQKQKSLADVSVSSLQPVQERLSDDTLEDVHALVMLPEQAEASRAEPTPQLEVMLGLFCSKHLMNATTKKMVLCTSPIWTNLMETNPTELPISISYPRKRKPTFTLTRTSLLLGCTHVVFQIASA